MRETFRTDYPSGPLHGSGQLFNKYGAALNSLRPAFASSWVQSVAGHPVGQPGMTIGIAEIVDATPRCEFNQEQGEIGAPCPGQNKYKAAFRYWDSSKKQWQTLDNDKGGQEFDLDAGVYHNGTTGQGEIPKYEKGDTIAAYFDPKRNWLVPIHTPPELQFGRALDKIKKDQTGPVERLTADGDDPVGKNDHVRNIFTTIEKDALVIYAKIDGVYLALPGISDAVPERITVRFVLDEDMGATTERQASATVLNAVGHDAPAEGATIIVHDPGDIYTHAIRDCEGRATNFGTADEPEYLIDNCERVAEWAMAALDAQTPMCPDDDPTIDQQSILFLEVSTGDARRPPPAGSYSLENFWGHAALENDFILLHRSFGTKIGNPPKWTYDVVETPKREIVIPKEWRIFDDSGTLRLQYRGYKAAVEHCSDQSDWQNAIIVTEDCPS